MSAGSDNSFISSYPSNVKKYTDLSDARNVEYTIQNPSTVVSALKLSSNSWSWNKTIYDPCPVGWRVPDGGPGVWEGIDTHITKDNGYYFNEPYSSPAAFYPGTGYTSGNEKIWYFGSAIYSWSMTSINDGDSYTMCMFGDTHDPKRSTGKNNEHPVRCMKIDNTGETGRGDDYIVDDEYEW